MRISDWSSDVCSSDLLPLIEQIVDEATVAVCAEATGVMQKLHEGTLDYTQQRKQFGIPIAKFQVLQHRMVDMFMEVEQARSMTIMGTLKLDLPAKKRMRSEEHTSELQSLMRISYAVFCLKKKHKY